MAEVSTQIRKLREARGLMQKDLAEMVGMMPARISVLESNGYDRHTMSTLKRLAKALDAELVVEFVPKSLNNPHREGI